MKAHHFRFVPILLGSMLLAACKTVPVVPHALDCNVNAELLAEQCAKPKPIPNDATYAKLVDTMQADRKALRECDITADTLREALKRCNHAADTYNKKIDALNATK